MKVKLLQDWIGKPAGTEIELEDAKAKRLMKTGLVGKIKVTKKSKSKERSNERTEKTARI